MNFDELYLMNPWWKDKNEIFRDRHIVLFQDSTFKYYPLKLFKQIDHTKPGIYTLRGPRQIGKTTFLKLFAKSLIENGTNPLDVLFITCDGFKDRFELIEIIKLYLQTFSSGGLKYLLIDEVTTIEDWRSSIKYLADIGLLDNSLLILTGSSSYDLKLSSERMPGRKGVGRDLVYLPLTFRAFLESLDIEIEEMEIEELLSIKEDELKALALKYAFVKEHFFRYYNSGGFPKVIDDFLKDGEIDNITKNVYLDFILGDADKYTKSRTKVVEIFKKLPQIIGQRFSWNSLLNDFDTFESVDTMQKYFEYLGYSFIIAIVFYIDISKRNIKPKKQKKVYPIDQIIASLIESMGNKEILISQKIEMIILRHLLKDSNVIYNGMNLYHGPYFWYSDRGNEIDFVFENSGQLIPVEVKYQNKINKFDYLGMKKVFGKGFLITKDESFRDGNIVGLPVWLFLGLIKS